MAKFPEPPAATALAAIPAEVKVLPVGTELWRLYFRGGAHPTLWNQFRAFGPTTSRFDHQLPPPSLQVRQILYAAAAGPIALAEAFQAARTIDRRAKDPWLVAFVLARPVALLDLTGTWPTRAGASMAIGSGPRPRAQRWSRRIYEAYPALAGVRYASSMHANWPAMAFYERAQPSLPPHPTFHRSLADPALLAALRNVVQDIGYVLI